MVPKLSTLIRISARAFVPAPRTAEQLVEVQQVVPQQSRGSRSRAQMVKQRVKVPKSHSRDLKRTGEQIDDIPAFGGDSTTSSTSLAGCDVF